MLKKNKMQHLFEENKEAIKKYNVNFYPKLVIVGIVISIIAYRFITCKVWSD